MYQVCMFLVALLLFARLITATIADVKTTSLKTKLSLNWICLGIVGLMLAWAIVAIVVGEGMLKLGGALEVLIALLLGTVDISNIQLNSKKLAEENKIKEDI